jgi:long-chain fatty acid transport protein
MGLSNAVVANTAEPGAIPFNPAVSAFVGKASVAGGVIGVKPDMSVSNTLGNPGKTFDSQFDDFFLVPMFHGHYAYNDEWSVAFGLNAPFGLETDWPSAAFGTGFALAGQPGKEPTKSKLHLLSFSPSVTYKINENAAISGGFDIYWATDLAFNTTDTKITNDDHGTGTGFHLAGIYKRGRWSAGLSYFSSPTIDLDGTVESGGMSIPAKTKVDLPWRAQVGVGYQATEKLNLEFDITRTGWSKFKEISIDHASLPVNLLTSTTNWKDANAYRFGATYQLSKKARLRLGYSYDETPQGDDHFSARTPDADRHLFSIGGSYLFTNGWDIDVGYMYVKFNDRTLDQSAPTIPGEANGSPLYNGAYESNVHLFGVGVSKRF